MNHHGYHDESCDSATTYLGTWPMKWLDPIMTEESFPIDAENHTTGHLFNGV